MIGISAVVATYNRRKELEKLFNSFISNRYEFLEVIIVDQNKGQLIDDLLEGYKTLLTMKHLKLDEPNQSKARNVGARQARYDIICFPDDDCWFDDDSIRKIGEHFNYNKNTDLLIINWRQNPRCGGKSQIISKQVLYSFKAPFHYATYVLVFTKRKFNVLGGFIEDIGIGLYIGGGEDSEIMFRAAKKELSIFYEATITVNHKYTPYFNRDLQSIRARQRGNGYIYSKYILYTPTTIKALLSPLVRMVICLNFKRYKAHLNEFLGKMEGLIYGLRN